MKKRIALAAMAAVLLALIVAPVARAATTVEPRDTSTSILTMQRTVWRIWVRGLNNAYRAMPTNATFRNMRASSGVTYTDAATGEVFGGLDLKTIVGMVDDKDPRTFNVKLATTAPGYLVNVAGADGFNYSFPSADVATKNIVVAGAVTVAGATVESGLPLGTAKYTTSKNKASFSPSWPLKLVGADLASGSQKIGGINLISLLPVPVTAKAAATVARDTSTSILTMQRTVWRIWVRGLNNAYRAMPTNATFRNMRASSGVTYTDAATGEVFGGLDLKTIVGMVDDKDPRTFNVKLATTAPGYLVNVAGADGFNYSFPSADVATKNIVVAGAVTVAGATVESGLPLGTAKYTTSKNKASFSPSWPLKLVGADLASGSQKIGGINLISLLPVPVTAK